MLLHPGTSRTSSNSSHGPCHHHVNVDCCNPRCSRLLVAEMPIDSIFWRPCVLSLVSEPWPVFSYACCQEWVGVFSFFNSLTAMGSYKSPIIFWASCELNNFSNFCPLSTFVSWKCSWWLPLLFSYWHVYMKLVKSMTWVEGPFWVTKISSFAR